MKFIHTSDWQLGMARAYLGDDGQARFAQDRIDVIAEIGRVAADVGAAFVVVAGDVFDANTVGPATVGRACLALAQVPVPVFLLPGNHDPLDPSSVFATDAWDQHVPDNVVVLDTTVPRTVPGCPGVEVVGAPWTSKVPVRNPAVDLLESVEPTATGRVRVVVAHGNADVLQADRGPLILEEVVLTAAVADGRAQYVALGDRHSTAPVGASGRVWFSGAPEVTSFRDSAAGQVLVVDVDGERVDVEPHRVGRWAFHREPWELTDSSDVDRLASWLEALPDKARTAVRLRVHGTLGVEPMLAYREVVGRWRDVLGSFEEVDLGLHLEPDDLADPPAGLTGYAADTWTELALEAVAGHDDASPDGAVADQDDETAQDDDAAFGHTDPGDDPAARTARDALLLLFRLNAEVSA